MMWAHPFWLLVTVLVIAWYSSVTVYVAIRGARDIRQMLRDLNERHRPPR